MQAASPPATDVVLGTALPDHRQAPFRLGPREQAYHGLLWGSTGTGKSRLLESIFLQHLNKGNGVCLIDPHSDLSVALIAYLLETGFYDRPDAFKRLVYIDFGQGGYVPFNVLDQPYDPHTTALNTFDALTRTWKDLRHAPLFKTLFLSSVVALIQSNHPITRINDLLLDPQFRAACLAPVSDPLIHQTFQFYEKLVSSQAGSTLRRAVLLTFSPVMRGILGQAHNDLRFRDLMDRGVCLIINLGSIADVETRRLLGSLLMVNIEQAALSRGNIPEYQRKPWTLLVDEWHSFSAPAETIENVLTQARKFKLRLYLAAQSLSQVDSARLTGVLENCRMSVTFRLGYNSARLQAQHIATIDPYRIKRAAQSPGQRDQYMSTSEQMQEWVQAIINLPPREAYVKVDGRDAVRIRTLLVPDTTLPQSDIDSLLAEYRQRFQRPSSEVEREIFAHPSSSISGQAPPVSFQAGQLPAQISQFDQYFGEHFSDPRDATIP